MELDEKTRELALLNLGIIASYAPIGMSEERAAINESAARTNIAILEYLDSRASCPYLDSLEDEEEEFCECGCGEDYPEPPPEQFSRTIKIGDFLSDGAYVPSLGTRIVFCSN